MDENSRSEIRKQKFLMISENCTKRTAITKSCCYSQITAGGIIYSHPCYNSMLQLPLTTKAVAASGLAFWQESEERGLKNEPVSLGVALWGRGALSSLKVKQANCPN